MIPANDEQVIGLLLVVIIVFLAGFYAGRDVERSRGIKDKDES